MSANSLSLPAQAPLMVLPGALLFPHALLPLYIFEPRYRAMLAHCLDGERMFCIALMKPGISEAVRRDQFFDVAGCGLVRACVGNPDGTANLILQGLARVRFIGFVQDKPFRIAEITELESQDEDTVEAEALGVKVVELCRQLKDRGLEPSAQLDAFLSHLTNLDMLADLVAHTFVADPFLRQTLMEETRVPARLRLLIQYLDAELRR
jgi:Lon protease-like protein